jgi:hypothetical protein
MTVATGFGDAACREIVSKTLENGGGTFGHLWGTPLDLNSGYMVSTDEDRGVVVKVEDFTATVVSVFVMNNLPYVYENIYGDGEYRMKRFGTWVADGYVHLDVVELVYDRTDAMLKGMAHGQLAIWDNAAGEEIAVVEGIASLLV